MISVFWRGLSTRRAYTVLLRERERETETESSSGYPTNMASGWLYVWLSSPYCLLERERGGEREREKERKRESICPRQKAGCSQSSPKSRARDSLRTAGAQSSPKSSATQQTFALIASLSAIYSLRKEKKIPQMKLRQSWQTTETAFFPPAR